MLSSPMPHQSSVSAFTCCGRTKKKLAASMAKSFGRCINMSIYYIQSFLVSFDGFSVSRATTPRHGCDSRDMNIIPNNGRSLLVANC